MQQSDVILNVDAFEVVYGLIALYYIGNLGESMCEKKEHVCVPSLYVCNTTAISYGIPGDQTHI